MEIATKRKGKIMIRLGISMTILSFLALVFFPDFLYKKIGEEYIYYPWGHIAFICFFLGPVIAVIGIPLFIIGARRLPSKVMELLKSNMLMRSRAKISFLAKQLRINEKEVISIVSRLRLAGEPVSIDLPTEEAIYDPTLLPPFIGIKKPSMTLYEKMTVILAILGILISVIIALLR